jgi:hypothetical protein
MPHLKNSAFAARLPLRLREQRIIDYVDTIWAIAASPYVKHYVIGYTSRQGWTRYKEHRVNGFDHLVILADKLTQPQASHLETELQLRIRNDRRHTNYRKYDPDRRDGAIYPSVGGMTDRSPSQSHSVYMAWWEP